MERRPPPAPPRPPFHQMPFDREPHFESEPNFEREPHFDREPHFERDHPFGGDQPPRGPEFRPRFHGPDHGFHPEFDGHHHQGPPMENIHPPFREPFPARPPGFQVYLFLYLL